MGRGYRWAETCLLVHSQHLAQHLADSTCSTNLRYLYVLSRAGASRELSVPLSCSENSFGYWDLQSQMDLEGNKGSSSSSKLTLWQAGKLEWSGGPTLALSCPISTAFPSFVLASYAENGRRATRQLCCSRETGG